MPSNAYTGQPRVKMGLPHKIKGVRAPPLLQQVVNMQTARMSEFMSLKPMANQPQGKQVHHGQLVAPRTRLAPTGLPGKKFSGF